MGPLTLKLIVDPNNNVNETYSLENGNYNGNWEIDNTMELDLEILDNITDVILIGVVIVIATVSLSVVFIKKKKRKEADRYTYIDVVKWEKWE